MDAYWGSRGMLNKRETFKKERPGKRMLLREHEGSGKFGVWEMDPVTQTQSNKPLENK